MIKPPNNDVQSCCISKVTSDVASVLADLSAHIFNSKKFLHALVLKHIADSEHLSTEPFRLLQLAFFCKQSPVGRMEKWL